MEQRRNVDFPYSEEECIAALYSAKWPEGFRCPECGYDKAYCITTRRLPLYECANCHAQPSLIVGTVVEGSKLPLASWFQAFRLHASPDGINALQLSKIISVTYKTAWLLCHKIRHAMSQAEAGRLLSGLVKITSTIYCIQHLTKHNFTWHDREQSLLIGVSGSRSGQFDAIKLKLQNKHALGFKREFPDPDAFIKHNVADEAKDKVVIMSIQKRNRDYKVTRIADLAQRRLGALFRGIGPKHLQTYLDQFCYDWNWRGDSKFDSLLRQCARTKTIIYRKLVGATLQEQSGSSLQSAA